MGRGRARAVHRPLAGTIPEGAVGHKPAMTIDLLPTIAGWRGAGSTESIIDGRDIVPLLAGHPKASRPHEALYFDWGRRARRSAAASGSCTCRTLAQSLELACAARQAGQVVLGRNIELSLFDLDSRPGESSERGGLKSGRCQGTAACPSHHPLSGRLR